MTLPIHTPKRFRVYRYYVGCQVYDVEGDTAEAANTKLQQIADGTLAWNGAGVLFLHEANDPAENHFFTEVFTYDETGEPGDDAVLRIDAENGDFWRDAGKAGAAE